MMLNILHCDTDDLDNPLHGGQPVRTFEINSRLAERHAITVLTSVYKGASRHAERGGVRYRRLGFRVPGLGLSPHLSFLACLGPAVRRREPDLVVEEFTPPVGFCLLPRWTDAPVVSVVQWYFFDWWEHRYKLPFSRMMRSLAARGWYRHFIVQSDAMGRELASFLPDAVFRKIPCGIRPDRLQGSAGDDGYVLFIGRLEAHQKGLDILMDAWAGVCAEKGVPLVIAGDGPFRAALEERVRASGWDGLVRFAGWVGGERKAELLRSCRLLAMPSREETFGITALEAMASAKPVAAFDIAHLNELVRPEWGALVEGLDAGGFGRAVLDLWSSPERCAALGQRGFEEAGRYGWDHLARQQESFYRDVVSDASRSRAAGRRRAK